MTEPAPYYPYPPPRQYLSAHSRAQIAVVLLLICAAICVLSIPAAWLGMAFPAPAETDGLSRDPTALVTVLLRAGLGLAQFFVYIITVIFFLLWLYRAYQNLPAFGYQISDIKYSSGWAVGSFFVPFVSLVVPYRAVRELWRKSQPASSVFTFSELSPPSFFPLWWAFWIASNIASNIYFRVKFESGMSPEAEGIFSILTDVLEIPAAILAIMVIREIDRRQTEASRVVNVQFPNPPPPPSFQPAQT